MQRRSGMKPTFPLALLLACALHGAQASTHTLEIDWGGAQRFEHEMALAPGWTLEACAPLSQEQRVNWTFHADGSLSFALLHRVGKRPYYAERRQRTRSLQGMFSPTQAVRHCWTWTNSGSQSVQLAFMLRH